jgi:NADH-quinone oxidoreductase subunit J
MSQIAIFYALAFLVTVCSVGVIAAANAVTSAMFLVGDLFLLAGLYALMGAHFIAAIQILVYAGAIIVLFVFVIMLLNLGPEGQRRLKAAPAEIAVLALTVIAFAGVAIALARGQPTLTLAESPVGANAPSNTFAVGMTLFTKFLWPFELASFLILLAIIAAVVIAKKDKALPAVGGKDGAH